MRDTAGRQRWWRQGVLVLAALLSTATAACAQAVAITQLDGEAVVTDGARRVAAVVGQRLAPGALIDSGATTALLRLEWPDGATVDLGPATRVMVAPPGWRARSGRPPTVYLLQGWAKVAGSGAAPAGGIVAPGFELLPLSGAAVAAVGPREQQLFAESGAAELLVRPAGTQRGIAPGALYNGDGMVLARPPADWLQRVPRAFRDPIPRRAAQLPDRSGDASALPAPTYQDLAAWLAAEPDVRREFPRRFSPLLQDPAFRRAVQQHLPAHPEWGAALSATK